MNIDGPSQNCIPSRERALLLRCLATALASGLGVDRSLELIARQSSNTKFIVTCRRIARGVRSGEPLSLAMKRFPAIFSGFHRSLVRVGEETGSLVSILEELSNYEQYRLESDLRVRQSLTVPLIAVMICLISAILIPPFLFRNLFDLLQGSGVELPWPTRALMGFSQQLHQPRFWLLGSGILFLGARSIRNTAWTARGFLLKVPCLGPAIQKERTYRFLRTLTSCLKVGLPLTSGLELAGSAADHPHFRVASQLARNAVEEGETLSTALAKTQLFGPLVFQAVEAGEQSGKLVELLESVNRLYALELENSWQSFLQILEPAALCLVGAIVGFTVTATFLPMVKMVETL